MGFAFTTEPSLVDSSIGLECVNRVKYTVSSCIACGFQGPVGAVTAATITPRRRGQPWCRCGLSWPGWHYIFEAPSALRQVHAIPDKNVRDT